MFVLVKLLLLFFFLAVFSTVLVLASVKVTALVNRFWIQRESKFKKYQFYHKFDKDHKRLCSAIRKETLLRGEFSTDCGQSLIHCLYMHFLRICFFF